MFGWAFVSNPASLKDSWPLWGSIAACFRLTAPGWLLLVIFFIAEFPFFEAWSIRCGGRSYVSLGIAPHRMHSHSPRFNRIASRGLGLMSLMMYWFWRFAMPIRDSARRGGGCWRARRWEISLVIAVIVNGVVQTVPEPTLVNYLWLLDVAETYQTKVCSYEHLIAMQVRPHRLAAWRGRMSALGRVDHGE